MVSIEPYGTEIEEIFYSSVKNQFDETEKTNIVSGCKKFFPPDFFVTEQDFKQLVLAPYSELKRVYEYIKQDENPMLQECFPLNANGKREIKEKYKKYCPFSGTHFGIHRNLFFYRILQLFFFLTISYES